MLADWPRQRVQLFRQQYGRVEVLPRWPARQVSLCPLAWQHLQRAAAALPDETRLILTRGYEPPGASLGLARRAFRAAGIRLFRTLFPSRRHELADIFGANGHDVDGTHLDVSIRWQGQRLRLLPLGVFTPRAWQQRRVRQVQPVVQQVVEALQQQGFRLHRNATEALQMHCDFLPEGTVDTLKGQDAAGLPPETGTIWHL